MTPNRQIARRSRVLVKERRPPRPRLAAVGAAAAADHISVTRDAPAPAPDEHVRTPVDGPTGHGPDGRGGWRGGGCARPTPVPRSPGAPGWARPPAPVRCPSARLRRRTPRTVRTAFATRRRRGHGRTGDAPGEVDVGVGVVPPSSRPWAARRMTACVLEPPVSVPCARTRMRYPVGSCSTTCARPSNERDRSEPHRGAPAVAVIAEVGGHLRAGQAGGELVEVGEHGPHVLDGRGQLAGDLDGDGRRPKRRSPRRGGRPRGLWFRAASRSRWRCRSARAGCAVRRPAEGGRRRDGSKRATTPPAHAAELVLHAAKFEPAPRFRSPRAWRAASARSPARSNRRPGSFVRAAAITASNG